MADNLLPGDDTDETELTQDQSDTIRFGVRHWQDRCDWLRTDMVATIAKKLNLSFDEVDSEWEEWM